MTETKVPAFPPRPSGLVPISRQLERAVWRAFEAIWPPEPLPQNGRKGNESDQYPRA